MLNVLIIFEIIFMIVVCIPLLVLMIKFLIKELKVVFDKNGRKGVKIKDDEEFFY